jgi:dGTPase
MDECRRYFTIRCIIDRQVKDVVTTTDRRLRDARVQSADEVRRRAEPVVRFSEARHRQNLELREYLYDNLYYNPIVHKPNLRAVRLLEDLFHFYLKHPREIGAQARKRVPEAGLERSVCDYIAGMTDRYVAQAHQRLFGRQEPRKKE